MFLRYIGQQPAHRAVDENGQADGACWGKDGIGGDARCDATLEEQPEFPEEVLSDRTRTWDEKKK